MPFSRMQFLRGELSGHDALRCNGAAWSVKGKIGSAYSASEIAMELPVAIVAEVCGNQA
jgi:hypothetical protein